MPFRSWVRWMLRVVLVLGVVLLGTGLLVRVYGQHRLAQARNLADQVFAGITPDGCAPPAVARDDDPVPLLRAGAAAWSLADEDLVFLGGLSARPSSAWSEEERRRAHSLLAAETTALELFHRAAEKGAAAFPLGPPRDGLRADPALVGLMRSSRVLTVHAQLAWRAGERQHAARSLAALARLATSLQHSNTILSLMIGGAAEKLLHGAVQPQVEDPAARAEDLVRVAALVPAEGFSQRWRCVLLHEQADLTQAVAQRLASADVPRRWALPNITGPLLEAQLLAFYARLAGAIDEPFGREPPWSARPSLWRDGVIAGIVAPNLTSTAARTQHLLASRQLLRTAIAVRRAALISGEYPQTLDAVPDARRPDPFTGEPLHYTLGDDGSATLSSPRIPQLYSDPRVASGITTTAPSVWRLPPPAPPPTR